MKEGDSPIVVPWIEETIYRSLDFLKKRYQSSMFLLGNFEDYGYELTEHMNSGRFKSIVLNDK